MKKTNPDEKDVKAEVKGLAKVKNVMNAKAVVSGAV